MFRSENDLTRKLRETEEALAAVLELAGYLQDDYSSKLPVIAAFRLWRSGGLTTDEFLARLREDDLAAVLRYEKAPPMKGLSILNDYRQAQRNPNP